MKNNNLYIIGNGFDIYHGIPSRYSDFKEYLKLCNLAVHDHVIEYLPVQENWCDLEVAFAHLDVDHVIDEAMQFLQSYSTEDWSDSYHHDYQYELDQIISHLSSGLKSHFCEWIGQLKLPLRDNLPCNPIQINRNGIYLTFNYTKTLQSVYGVGNDNVLHVHGESEQDESEIVLGHSWDPEDIPDLNDVPNPEDMDTRINEGNELVNAYFGRTFKPSRKIIEENASFFSNLSSISKIYVLGHSISEVDLPYFEEVAGKVNESAEWVVTYYDEEELDHHKEKIRDLGIDSVIFCGLPDVV